MNIITEEMERQDVYIEMLNNLEDIRKKLLFSIARDEATSQDIKDYINIIETSLIAVRGTQNSRKPEEKRDY